MPVIETDQLTKLYGSAPGIEDVTIAVDAAEVFGFLGPNGAGKTTTIRTLLDLLHPTRGRASVFGLDSRRDSVAIRSRLGNLPGDFGYEATATGRAAVSLLARLRGIAGTGRAEALAERFRADLDRPLGQLSRGNRQKVGLILATFHEPELLILDEPTSGLDPLMQEEFLALVEEERERGCTVFLSSHELRSLPGVSDLEVSGSQASFRVSGDLDPMIKALARHHVSDLELTHPTLEEIFLTYYETGGER